MKGLQVQCPSCKKIRHVTTEHYTPGVTPKGNFVELIDPWKSWRWNTYDDEGEAISTTPCSLMTCPGCAAPLAPTGQLTIAVDPQKQKEKRIGSMISMWNKPEVDQERIIKAVKNLPKGDSSSFWIKQQDNKFVCDICGKVCKSKAGLMAHKRSHKD